MFYCTGLNRIHTVPSAVAREIRQVSGLEDVDSGTWFFYDRLGSKHGLRSTPYGVLLGRDRVPGVPQRSPMTHVTYGRNQDVAMRLPGTDAGSGPRLWGKLTLIGQLQR